MASDTPAAPAAPPDLIIKFEGELTPEQLAKFRALWECGPKRAWTAHYDIAYAAGRADERQDCARLAEQHNAQCYQACTDPDCGGHLTVTAHSHHLADFADLIRARTTP